MPKRFTGLRAAPSILEQEVLARMQLAQAMEDWRWEKGELPLPCAWHLQVAPVSLSKVTRGYVLLVH